MTVARDSHGHGAPALVIYISVTSAALLLEAEQLTFEDQAQRLRPAQPVLADSVTRGSHLDSDAGQSDLIRVAGEPLSCYADSVTVTDSDRAVMATVTVLQ